MLNILNGGKHAADSTDFQEFMVMPLGAPNYREGLRWAVDVYHSLKRVLTKMGHSTNVGDEGGFAPSLGGNEPAIEVILEAIDKAGYSAGKDVAIALDPASSEFYKNGKYVLEAEREKERDAGGMIAFYKGLCDKYPILSIEDGLAENDWAGWKRMTQELGGRVQLVGDDLFVTNTKFLRRGIEEGCANSILVKVNQIGTLTETFDAMDVAFRNAYTCVVSHRSGETEDTTIADVAVAANSGQIKTGSLSRSDRLAKYNRLLRIEDELADTAQFPGVAAFRRRNAGAEEPVRA
jgi:enolase